MTKDEALLMALEAMESVTVECNNFHHPKKDQNHHWAKCPPIVRWDKAITAIKEALAQPEQEPVAYLCENAVGHKYFRWKKPPSTYKPIALYTTPPQRTWVGLTDEEVDECYYWKDRQWTTDELVRHVEAKLKQKNGYAEEKNT